MTFQSLGISKKFEHSITLQGYSTPTEIQQEAIPAILDRRDILGIAPTGSGKTASYVLPLLTLLLSKKKIPARHIQALILVPTRELAMQVTDVCLLFSNSTHTRLSIKSAYGGVSINPQLKAMKDVDILVATPGRLLELIEKNALFLSSVHTFIMDEADKLLNLGFRDELESVLKLLPPKRQNLLFSATLNPAIEEINQLILHRPKIIHITPTERSAELINQFVYYIPAEKKGPLLRHIIRSRKDKQVLVFTSSTRKADNLAGKLSKNKINARAIHGKKSQGARTEALQRFKAGTLQVLVTTDLLSRGIDIEFLPCVINYELPRSPKDYIHRIGRTGRAENPGDAISFVSPEEEHHFKVIQKKMKISAEKMELPEDVL